MKFHSKIGDVYKIQAAGISDVFVQLVHIDPVQMNSDVVVVFKDKSGAADFYMHTTLEQGIRNGVLIESQNKPIAVDLGNLAFKTFMEDYLDEGLEPYWHFWTCLDTEWKEIELKEGLKIDAPEGSIYPITDLLYRVRNEGRSGFKQDWPKS